MAIRRASGIKGRDNLAKAMNGQMTLSGSPPP
jgi:hypothetical protein